MVRQCSTHDLPDIIPIALQFAELANASLNVDLWLKNWTSFIEIGTGVIFVLESGKGMLGGAKYPDINSGELVAVEFFWYVDPQHRGEGLSLLNAFETWAKTSRCKKVMMVHLVNSMPERLSALYRRRGYSAVETHYCKEI